MERNKKALGFWTLSALVAGNMIGSGVYLLPSALAAFGTISIISWCLTAIGAIFLALVFASLSKNMPLRGGPYAYCRAAYGDFIGFSVAYNYWIALWVGNAAIALAFTGYLAFFIPEVTADKYTIFLVSTSVVWFLTFINILGVRAAGIVQLVTTILKLSPLIVISVIGIFYIDLEKLMVFNVSGQGSFDALLSAAALTLWSFIGLESASIPVGDVDNPSKVIPRATMFGTLVAAIVYIASTIVVFGTISNSALITTTAPFAIAANMIFGGVGGALIAFGAVIACFGTLNGWILIQGQIPAIAAKDKLFPKIFSKFDAKGTPTYSLILSAVLITILLAFNLSSLLVDQFKFIISLAVFLTLIPYLFTTIGEIILYIKYPERFSKKTFTKSAIISLIAFIFSLWMVYGTGKDVVFYGILLFLSGLPIYAWIYYTQSKHVS